MKRHLRYLGFVSLALLILIAAGFLIWASNPANPEQTALDNLGSSTTVEYQNMDGWLVFLPKGEVASTGLIFYPGGRVDYRAYAPLAHKIAESGFLVVVVRMPLNFAFFGLNQVSEVIASFPDIDHWAVGGHSLGGAMAAQYASSNLQEVEGLVFWASYPAGNNDLSKSDLEVISIYATNDGLATIQDIDASRANLPDETSYVEIQGGNHAGFGWYGPQNGDGQAEITKTNQQEQIINVTIIFLEGLNQ